MNAFLKDHGFDTSDPSLKALGELASALLEQETQKQALARRPPPVLVELDPFLLDLWYISFADSSDEEEMVVESDSSDEEENNLVDF